MKERIKRGEKTRFRRGSLTGIAGGLWARRMGFIILTGIWWAAPALILAQQGSVQMAIESAKSSYQMGEPIIVTIKLINATEETVQFNAPSLEHQTMHYSIRSGDGPYGEYDLSFVIEPHQSPVDLPPGGVHLSEQLIHFNYAANALAFALPGSHTLRAQYIGFLSVAPAPPPVEISFQITANPEEERAGSALFAQRAAADFLLGISRDAALSEQLTDLIRTAPDSLFSLYARYYLAATMAGDYRGGPPDFETAVGLMKGVDRAGFALRPMALFHLGQWRWNLGLAPETAFYLDRVIVEFPGTYAARLAAQMKTDIANRDPPVPLQRPAQRIPVAGDSLNEIVGAINGFFDMYQNKDEIGIQNLLDGAFSFNGVLDKAGFVAELQEDFAKLAGLSGDFKVVRDVTRVDTVQGATVAEVQLTFLQNEQPLAPAKNVRITLVQAGGKWLFEAWDEL